MEVEPMQEKYGLDRDTAGGIMAQVKDRLEQEMDADQIRQALSERLDVIIPDIIEGNEQPFAEINGLLDWCDKNGGESTKDMLYTLTDEKGDLEPGTAKALFEGCRELLEQNRQDMAREEENIARREANISKSRIMQEVDRQGQEPEFAEKGNNTVPEGRE